jgi:hypothetical protein
VVLVVYYMTEPYIANPNGIEWYGLRNAQLAEEHTRFVKGTSYRDLSTIMVVPSITIKRTVHPRAVPGVRGTIAQSLHNIACKMGARCPEIATPGIPEAVVFSWLSLMTPANQKFTRISLQNCEVADAYNQAVRIILDDEGLSAWKWMLTVESDNLPPPTGLLQLLDDAESGNWDAIGGLYYQKGEGGGPMAYGRPDDIPKSFKPWIPPPHSVVPVNGIAMGFSLFKIDMFKHIPPPWFHTTQEWIPGVGEHANTQDLYFAKKAAKAGYRFAVSTNVLVGHLDVNTGKIW